MEELSAAHDDMRNLLNSTEIATVFVDNEMRIRRFTPQATAIINLIQTDTGRPLQHVVSNLRHEGMIDDLAAVLRTLTPRELEVETMDNRWYKMRIIPYRTTDNRIDGAVLTFSSIDEQKKAQKNLSASNREMSQAWHLVRDVFDLTPEPQVVLDKDGTIVLANAAFVAVMGIAPEQIGGMDIEEVNQGVFKGSELGAKLQVAVEKGEELRINSSSLNLPKNVGVWSLRGRGIGADAALPSRFLLQFIKETENGS